jgi:hypothetical protein
MVSNYVNDIYVYYMRLEKQFAIKPNFLDGQMEVTPKMRSVLLDWIFEIQFGLELTVETLYMTVSIIDRFLQGCQRTPRDFLQLVGVTAMFIAAKLEEVCPPAFHYYKYITNYTYDREQILAMEIKMLNVLKFEMFKPLPIHFLRRYAKAARLVKERQYIRAKYFIELAAIDYELTQYNPSLVAAAAIYLTIYIANEKKSIKDLWTPTLVFYSTYIVKDFLHIAQRLALLAMTAREATLKTIFKKYSLDENMFVAILPEMTDAKMCKFARQT